jgi:hypothetical protein
VYVDYGMDYDSFVGGYLCFGGMRCLHLYLAADSSQVLLTT